MLQEKESYERVLLAGVDTGTGGKDFARSMEELKSLAEACFMEPAGMVTQKMEKVHKGLYIGTGKVQEIKDAILFTEADVVVFNDTLSPAQLRNLQNELKIPILDRTSLILDIFAIRARTREAKRQVEAAKLKYLLPRLVGMHEALTRQGGTSGSMSSRGAGEKKLELDRRRIEHRISELNRELEEVAKERQVQRKMRKESRIPLVALVGYTNAGKSTVMNSMIDIYVQDDEKKVLEQDMLFATLDTAVRRISTGNNKDFLLSDTVGFIHKLPPGLVKAFHSTLDEVKDADLLLHVVDSSDDDYREQMKDTEQVLAELGAGSIPMVTVFNKADQCEGVSYPQTAGTDKIYLCAKEESSIRLLVDLVLERVYEDYTAAEFLIPYANGEVVSYFMEYAHVASCEYEADGTRMKVRCHRADKEKFARFLIVS